MTGKSQPALGELVTMAKSEGAIAVNDFIWIAKDVPHAYLVNGEGAHFLVNTGTVLGAADHRAAFAPHASGPLRAIIVTQSHPDHFGGVATFRQDGTQVVADHRFPRTLADYQRTAPYLDERTFRLWEPLLGNKMRQMRMAQPFEVDLLVDGVCTLEIGSRRVDILSMPGGETPDSLVVSLPAERIVFTGNLFGPAWLNLPNLYTIRGDRIRSAAEYLRCLDRVAAFAPQLLITGHGEPIAGEQRIAADLARMRGAVQHLLDYTLDGMAAGHDLRELMHDVALPPGFEVGQLHGKASWNVRAIWEEHVGWFDYGSTTGLYHVPAAAIAPDIVELAGGTDRLIARARQHVEAGRPLEALHFTDIILAADPRDEGGLRVKLAAVIALLGSGKDNLSETMWLQSEALACRRALGETA